jgi:crotonobetainyl-CoA:carnitine CoA-transferase CaiB-like acyl-CoA transferase
MLLGDAGANVIKLERTGKGDDTRSWGPPFVGQDEKLSTYFLSVNRRKKSIAVDIKQKEGLNICHRLATEWADVLVENFKGGTMDRLGLGYESLSKSNPGLVYCSISGFGSTGPFSKRPGYDLIVSGMYGLMSITGDEQPSKVGVASIDVLTGTLAQSGILSALYARQTTGYGRKVDVSLMETQLAGLVNIASSTLNAPPGTPEPKRWGTAHESIVPYQAFRCRPQDDGNGDQYIVVGAGNDAQFVKFCEVLGVTELARDPRFRTNADRVANRSVLVPLLEEYFKEKPRNEWVNLLEVKGFASGPLRTVSEAFQCEQAVHRGIVEETDHPVVGKIRLPRTPISFSTPGTFSNTNETQGENEPTEELPPPMLGEHTEEVLTDILEMSSEEISLLEANDIIGCWRPDSSTH